LNMGVFIHFQVSIVYEKPVCSAGYYNVQTI